MGGVIAILLFILRIIIKLHVKAISFLFKHFEITNGLIVGLMFQICTEKIDFNIWIRAVIVLCIIAFSIIIQYFFIPARIVLGLFGSIMSGIIVYVFFNGNNIISPVIPFAITLVIAMIINTCSCVRRIIDKNSEKTRQTEE